MARQRIRFDTFELDLGTGELHQQSRRVPLQDQPARLLILLASRPGELVTRNEIYQTLWTDGEFVEFEHAVNVAVRKIRVALGDDSDQPRIIETLPKKGYRFIAPVESLEPMHSEETIERKPEPFVEGDRKAATFVLPVSDVQSRRLFLLAQVPYIATYLTAFYHWYGLKDVLANTFSVVPVEISVPALQAIALIGFAVRIYLIGLVGWGHPEASPRFQKIFPILAVLDGFWAATPLLVEHSLGPLVAWAGLILMGWLIFGQRTLVQRIGDQH